ncbi:MAG: hypothetical protein WBW79_18565, partial [Desulfocapsaceae bacterium]
KRPPPDPNHLTLSVSGSVQAGMAGVDFKRCVVLSRQTERPLRLMRKNLVSGRWSPSQCILSRVSAISRAFCKTKIFFQNQNMREILPQAYN